MPQNPASTKAEISTAPNKFDALSNTAFTSYDQMLTELRKTFGLDAQIFIDLRQFSIDGFRSMDTFPATPGMSDPLRTQIMTLARAEVDKKNQANTELQERLKDAEEKRKYQIQLLRHSKITADKIENALFLLTNNGAYSEMTTAALRRGREKEGQKQDPEDIQTDKKNMKDGLIAFFEEVNPYTPDRKKVNPSNITTAEHIVNLLYPEQSRNPLVSLLKRLHG